MNENTENISFEEFIKLMEHVEKKLAKDDPNNLIDRSSYGSHRPTV